VAANSARSRRCSFSFGISTARVTRRTEIFGAPPKGKRQRDRDREREREWLNEEKRGEGLRDYRCEQSAKKRTSTYSLLGRTYISRPGMKDGVRSPRTPLFFSDSLTYAAPATLRARRPPFIMPDSLARYASRRVIYPRNFRIFTNGIFTNTACAVDPHPVIVQSKNHAVVILDRLRNCVVTNDSNRASGETRRRSPSKCLP